MLTHTGAGGRSGASQRCWELGGMKGKFPVVGAEVWESEMLPVSAICCCNACEEPQKHSKGKGTTEHLTGSSGGREAVHMGPGSWSFLQSQNS